MLTVKAPAKINLTLEVLGKRPDGYHEIKSVFQAIDLCDTLRLEAAREVIFKCDRADWAMERSLVKKTIDLLKNTTGNNNGVKAVLEKRIPLQAGLGGDSSDAAALLYGLNRLWQLGLAPEDLRKMAGELGSDVTFFLSGGTALAEGRGEKVTPLPTLSVKWVVLVVPEIAAEPGKTGRMYASLKPNHFTDGQITARMVRALHNIGSFSPSLVFNTFENIAFNPASSLYVYKEHLIKLGATHVHLAGSGPALFTLFEDKGQAKDYRARCQKQGMKAYLAATR